MHARRVEVIRVRMQAAIGINDTRTFIGRDVIGPGNDVHCVFPREKQTRVAKWHAYLHGYERIRVCRAKKLTFGQAR